MPLKPGSSKKVVSQNISEFHTGKTYAHTEEKFGKEKADKQAIAVALSNARKYGRAYGGMAPWYVRQEARSLTSPHGMINSAIPGRTDKLPMNVAAGSYILPADIPSAIGQGNSMAGGQILSKMFTSGPYGLPTMKSRSSGYSGPRLSLRPPRIRGYAGGGSADDAIESVMRRNALEISKPYLDHIGPNEAYDDSPTIAAGNRAHAPIYDALTQEGGKYPANKEVFPGQHKLMRDVRSAQEEMHLAKGGKPEHVPIIAAGGEFVIHPDVVLAIGHGNIDHGHQILDEFVKHIREKHIKTLKKLPGPKK